MSVESGQELAWQCNLTGDSWVAQTPAGIHRSCFAPTAAKMAFVTRLLGGGESALGGSSLTPSEVMAHK